jgi:fructokinase
VSPDTLKIGVDLGGTKTEAVVVQLGDEPKVLARKRVPTERDRGYDHILEATRALVVDVTKEAGLKALVDVGVGMPGSVSRRTGEELVKNANTTVLNGRPFRQDLARALAVNVRFANDANCFALAEATWGAAREARVAFGVIMGTGVGGGVVFDRKAWDGVQGIAGEWGHVVLDPEAGPPCYCGRRGCIETFLSGPAIERAYRERTGKDARLPEIALAEDAKELLAERIELFGRALATVIDVLDPDVIVLGGGVSNLAMLYDEGVKAVGRWVFNDVLETRIVKHSLGDSAGVLGAALL